MRPRTILPTLVVAAWLAGPLARPAAAQQADSTARLDSLDRIADAGQRAANRPDVGGRFTVGFVGGVVTGFTLPVVLVGRGAGVVAGGLALGGFSAMALAADSPKIAVPPAGAPAPADTVYRAEYERAYRSRLEFRRRRAAVVGGVTGIVSGGALLVGVLIALLGASD